MWSNPFQTARLSVAGECPVNAAWRDPHGTDHSRIPDTVRERNFIVYLANG